MFPSILSVESDGGVLLCVQVTGTMATVGTAFGVTVQLADITASKRHRKAPNVDYHHLPLNFSSW